MFRSPPEVDVDGRRVRSATFVVATGAAPLVPPIEGLSEIHPLTNENLSDLDELPPCSTGPLAQTVHAYPTWSLAVQQAATQFFFEIGGREARPARR